METVADLFQRQSPIGHSTKQTDKTSSNSALTRTSSNSLTQQRISHFKQRYPTADRVKNAFSPKNWGRFANNIAACIEEPSARLNELDSLYAEMGLAKSILTNNIRAIYRMSSTKDILNEEALDITAGLFIAKNGACTPYTLMIFFANYFTDFKTTMSAFELGDILRSFKAKFTPAWNTELSRADDRNANARAHQEQVSTGYTGMDALRQFIYETVKSYGGGEEGLEQFCQHSGLVRCGFMSKDEARVRCQEFQRMQSETF